jgi:uncharacterized protein YdcH (DUF465 family)
MDALQFDGSPLKEAPMPDRQVHDVHVGSESEEFDRLSEKHRRCEERLGELRGRLILTEQEKVEEVVLKKQKLMLKDRMEAIARDGPPRGIN